MKKIGDFIRDFVWDLTWLIIGTENKLLKAILIILYILVMPLICTICWILFIIGYTRYGKGAWQKQLNDQIEWIQNKAKKIN